MTAGKRLAVVGGGWAGLAAAIEAVRLGHDVTLFEMSPQLGGRARGIDARGIDAQDSDGEQAAAEQTLDNGQHILIGAYVETLRLLELLKIDATRVFVRTPLRISYPDGTGLLLKPGPAILAFAGAVMRQRGWTRGERLKLLATATRWFLQGFRCDASATVATLTAGLPTSVRDDLIDPLCVAALNTLSRDASGTVFLRVLKDALFSGAGSADLLLPCASLSDVFPEPAGRWLIDSGAKIRYRHRVGSLTAHQGGWQVEDEAFNRVVLATPPGEAARLTQTIAPEWSRAASALHYEPIITVYLRSKGTRLPEPMLALRADDTSPAQFVFDRGQLGGADGLLAFVISGAQQWVERGMEAALQATIAQAKLALASYLRGSIQPVRTLIEKRATFRCTPDLRRPPMYISTRLHAAGDHVAGPYPATLEGAVRSSLQAVRSLG